MSKHTPGSWEVSYSELTDSYDIENDNGILVAEVYGEYDARLMAQSKRLLKTLRDVLRTPRGTSGRIILEAEDEADIIAAIAAATEGDSND